MLLAYSNVEFDDTTANIVNDCPFAVCDIWFDAVVWAPKIGMKLCESLTTTRIEVELDS